MRLLPLLLLLAASPTPAADPAGPPPPPEAAAAASPPVEASSAPATQSAGRLPQLGLRLAAGIPEGGTLSLVVRPLPGLRLEAGPAWNYLGWGWQVGAGFQPFQGVVSPVLDLSYGHFFDADVSRRFPSAPVELQPLIQHFHYDYAAAMLSLEFGSVRGLSFSIGGGVAYFWTTIPQAVTVIQNPGTPQESTVTFDHPSFRAVVPTLKFGVLSYF